MEHDKSLRLKDQEIAHAFCDPDIAARYGPVLTLEEAAELVRLPLGTMRDWRSRGLLASCAIKTGRHVRLWRDRFIKAVFNDLIATSDE